MDGCSLNMLISSLACAVAKGKSNDEIALLSVFFSQLGDSLATISTFDSSCMCDNEETGESNNLPV